MADVIITNNSGNLAVGKKNPEGKVDVEGTIIGKVLISNPQGTSAGQTGELRLRELSTNGSNSVGFKAPDTISSDLIWVLPSTDGTSGQVLSTNGSGILSWASGGGAGLLSANNLSDVANRQTSLNNLAGTQTSNRVLISNGTNVVFGQVSLSSGVGTVTGTLAVANGGTGSGNKTFAFNNLSPLTTKGDVCVADSTTNSVRLPVGTDGQVLTADSSSFIGVGWADPSAGTTTSAGALINSATPKTTLVDNDMFGVMDSAASNVLKKFSVANLKSLLLSFIYPIGSIYTSVVNTNPGTLFGGTWSAFGTGRTLVAVDTSQTEFDTVEKTGGAKTHTLISNEIPSHTHIQQNSSSTTGGSQVFHNIATTTGSGTSTNGFSTQATGGGAAHNNLQPYITVYFWKRTA